MVRTETGASVASSRVERRRAVLVAVLQISDLGPRGGTFAFRRQTTLARDFLEQGFGITAGFPPGSPVQPRVGGRTDAGAIE